MIYNNIKTLIRLFRLFFRNRRSFSVIRKVRQSRLTYLENNALLDLHDCIADLSHNKNEGIIVEAGCALGGSALVIASAKEKTRPLFLYDAFEMIPPPSEEDESDAHLRYAEIASGKATGIGNNTYYGYQENLLGQVKDNFQGFGFSETGDHVTFIKGLYEDTLHIDQPVAMAHLDCDWYQSVMICLERIVPNLIPGGVIVVDDYEAWSGCRKAIDEYFNGREDEFDFQMRSRLHIVKK